MKDFLTNISGRYYAWINFNASLAIWSLVIRENTPPGVVSGLNEPILSIWTLIAITGGLLAIAGCAMTAQRRDAVHKYGTIIEMGGLLLMLVGPIIYASTQVTAIVGEGGTDRLHLPFLAWTAVSAIFVRISIVTPRLLKVLDDMKDRRGGSE